MKVYLPILGKAIVYLVIAGGFLFYYLNKQQPKFHKKWWVLLIALIFLTLATREAYVGIHQKTAQRIPTTAELADTFKKSGAVASDEFLYKSPDGYQILIPKGFTYSPSQSIVSLIATNKNSDQKNSIAIVVVKQPLMKNVDSLVKDLVQIGAKSTPPTKYVFEEKGRSADERRGFTEVSKNNILMRTELLLVQHEKSLYRVAITTSKNNFEQEKPEIEKIFASFKVL